MRCIIIKWKKPKYIMILKVVSVDLTAFAAFLNGKSKGGN